MKKMMCLLMLLFCCGCSAEMTEKAQQKYHSVKAEQEADDRTPGERAMIIKERLKQIDGIVGTAVVVEGHTAIIGLRTEEGLNVDAVDFLRKKAEVAAKEADVSVETASVTTNRYVVSLIEEVEWERSG